MKDIPSSEWLQQWTDLARRFAFQYNPALQPRAIIVFGCISKTVTDSEVKQLLKIMMKVSVMSVSKVQLCVLMLQSGSSESQSLSLCYHLGSTVVQNFVPL